jgi:hypothetical protein
MNLVCGPFLGNIEVTVPLPPRIKAALLVALLGGLPFDGFPASSPIDPATVQDLAIPYYAQGQSSPAAVIRIRRLFTDHQRKGFFRIGLFPILVADEVKVEVIQPDAALAGLNAARAWLKPKAAKKSLEWRHVQVFFRNEPKPRLEVDRILLADQGGWRLSGPIHVTLGTNEFQALEGLLQVTGPQAGQLTLGGSGNLNILQLCSDSHSER